jgi:hypothetical protein
MNWQETLEAVGIPVSLAKEADLILQKESENPFYERTQKEQEIIKHSHVWWVAQGMKTVGDRNEQR